jgi:hypothetical protein
MKFLDAIEKKLMFLEQDAAMPADPNAPQVPSPDQAAADQVDKIGNAANEQVQSNVKLCADIINALVVFVRGKFADEINATPGLSDQLRELERQTTITDVTKADLKLLQAVVNAVEGIKGL